MSENGDDEEGAGNIPVFRADYLPELGRYWADAGIASFKGHMDNICHYINAQWSHEYAAPIE